MHRNSCLSNEANNGVMSLAVNRWRRKILYFDFLAGPYAENFSDTGDQLSVKQGSGAFGSFHMCLVKRMIFTGRQNARRRDGTETLKLISWLHCSKHRMKPEKDFENFFLRECPLFSNMMSFVGWHLSVLLQADFWTEAKHTPQLGKSKIIKDRLTGSLSDPDRMFSLTMTVSNQIKIFENKS